MSAAIVALHCEKCVHAARDELLAAKEDSASPRRFGDGGWLLDRVAVVSTSNYSGDYPPWHFYDARPCTLHFMICHSNKCHRPCTFGMIMLGLLILAPSVLSSLFGVQMAFCYSTAVIPGP